MMTATPAATNEDHDDKDINDDGGDRDVGNGRTAAKAQERWA
jgi:hypothetical protein